MLSFLKNHPFSVETYFECNIESDENFASGLIDNIETTNQSNIITEEEDQGIDSEYLRSLPVLHSVEHRKGFTESGEPYLYTTVENISEGE